MFEIPSSFYNASAGHIHRNFFHRVLFLNIILDAISFLADNEFIFRTLLVSGKHEEAGSCKDSFAYKDTKAWEEERKDMGCTLELEVGIEVIKKYNSLLTLEIQLILLSIL